MRNLIAPMIAAALVLAFSLQPSTSAQSSPMPVAPSGADLEAKAKAFLSAMQSNSAENVFAQLVPWRRAEAELYRARTVKAGRGAALKWERIEKQVKAADPANKLNVLSLEDYLALNAPQMFGLAFGMFRVAANADSARLLADEWFAIDRKIGLCEPSDRRGEAGRSVMETGGQVTLESVDGAKLTVFCVADGREWFVVEAGFEGLGREPLMVRTAMAGLSGEISKGRKPGADSRASEGEQLAGSMKNRVRVAHVKMDKIPTKLTGTVMEGGCDVRDNELDAKHYKARDAVYGGTDWFAVVSEPHDESDPWIVLACNVKSGRSEIFSLDSKDEAETKLAELNREGYAEKGPDAPKEK